VSSGSNREAVGSCFNDSIRDEVQVVDAQNPLDLSKESSQQSEVSAGHPDQTRDAFRDEWLVGEGNAGGRPSLFKQLLHLSSVEGAELVDEPDP
jgi:hypothetical protein